MHASRQLVGDKYTECEAASAMHQYNVTLKIYFGIDFNHVVA